MWIIRYQNIQSADYTKIKSLCKKAGFVPKKFSATILVKWILSHIFLKKSWRAIATQFGLPYLPIYQFYQRIKSKPELLEILEYLWNKWIIIYMADWESITREMLESWELITSSISRIKKEL